jgi:hypothetical protein
MAPQELAVRWDNEALAPKLPGFRPARQAPIGSGGAPGMGTGLPDKGEGSDDEAV